MDMALQHPPYKPLTDKVDEAQYEGVPAHLTNPLQRWLIAYSDQDLLSLVAVRIRKAWVPLSGPSGVAIVRDFFRELCDLGGNAPLEAIHALLYIQAQNGAGAPGGWPASAIELERILESGGSSWRLNDEMSGLERRVPEAVLAAFRQAVSDAETKSTSAAEHLATGWKAAYGLTPDASKAYGEAVRALEAAARPLVEPNNSKATLGTIIGTMRSNAGGWHPAIVGPGGRALDADPVLSMLKMLWEGQTDRHGAQPTVAVSLEAARAALHLAAALVQWFCTGSVTRVP